LANSLNGLGEGFPIGNRTVGLMCLPRGADGGVEVGPSLGFVLGFVQVADRAEAVGVAVARFGEQDVGSADVLFDARETRGAGDGDAVRANATPAAAVADRLGDDRLDLAALAAGDGVDGAA
jgi:hypothetical protein